VNVAYNYGKMIHSTLNVWAKVDRNPHFGCGRLQRRSVYRVSQKLDSFESL